MRATPAGLLGVTCVFEVSGAVKPARSVFERVAWNRASWLREKRQRCTRLTSRPGVVDLLHAAVET